VFDLFCCCCGWTCCWVEPKRDGVDVWFCWVDVLFPNKEGVVVCCVEEALQPAVSLCVTTTVDSTYNSDGFDWVPPNSPPDWDEFWVWFWVLVPNAPPNRPPLCGCVDCAVDEPKRPPLAGAAVAGLFRLPKRPPLEGWVVWGWPPKSDPDCACCGCCVDPKSPPLL